MDKYKGKKGYISLLKRYDMIFILVSALIALGVFMIGLNIWNTKKNIGTVVAVLSLLPACKRLTNLIMIFSFKGISEENYAKVAPLVKPEWLVLEDMLFSTEKYILEFDHVVLSGSKMFALSKMSKDKNDYIKEYFETAFKKRAIDMTFNLYSNVNDYAGVLKRMEGESFENEKATDYIFSLLV